MNARSINWLLPVLSVLLLGGAFNTQALTLRETVSHTLETNPEVLAAMREHQARSEEIRQARAAYLPQLSLTAGLGRERLREPATGGVNVELTRKESALQARQLVFDGFATRSEVRRQTARTSSADYSVQASAENIALRTTEVYLNVLRQFEVLDLARKTQWEHQNIHDQMVLRNKSGVGSKADLDQISARLALASSNMVAAQNNLLDARTNFFRVTGMFPEIDSLSVPSFETELPKSIEQAVEFALETHPTLKSASADVEAANAQYEASESGFWPSLQIEADKNWDEDIGGVEGDNEDLIVALRLRYNLYSGGADSARRKQTAYLLEEAKEVRNNTHRQVVEGLRLSWSALHAVSEQMKYLEAHVKAATDTREAYRKQFNIGRRTLLDLLNTENEVFDSNRSLVNAKYDKLFAQYRILNSMGRLVSEFKANNP